MGKRTGLYTVCLILFPVAFSGFVVGFGCPVWVAGSVSNEGLWQVCSKVFKDCRTRDFDDGGDWMVGVRAVEIFALVMLAVAAAELAYETCCSKFSGRKSAERVAPGVLCVLGGLGGLSGVIVYAIKTEDAVNASGSDLEYSWAFMLVAAGAGLAFLLGVGFCVSGVFLEKAHEDPDKAPINAYGTPYLPSSHGGESYEMTAFTNKALADGAGDGARPSPTPLPGYALYNGMARSSLSPQSLPQEPTSALPYYYSRPGPPPSELKSPQYYSEEPYPQFDLSEGYLPSRPRAHAESPYYVRDEGPYLGRRDFRSSTRADDPYVPGERGEDPYSRGRRVEDAYARGQDPRAGYPDGSRFLAGRGEGGAYEAYEDRRESFYRQGRY